MGEYHNIIPVSEKVLKDLVHIIVYPVTKGSGVN